MEKVKTVFEKNKGRYGSPRIHAELKKQQITCSLGRVKRLMRREGLYAVSGKKYRSKRERCDLETRNLLLEQPRPSAINQVWHRLPPTAGHFTWSPAWISPTYPPLKADFI